ncbi:protein ZBED8-like [Sipha flava]|uniref:Protein ZBED8-like n=1 Tax=Sipha flava TaxID=143950 RepID=A0A8B8GJX4_9HEMI|nr:protein ZBED8-like [Sipha flava]
MAAFKGKLLIWKRRVNDNNLDMFPLTANTKFTDKIIPIINDSLTLSDQKLDHYFSSLDLKLFDWVRNPFNPSLETSHFSLKEEEELAELKNDRTFQMKFNELELSQFWIYTKKEYPNLTKLAHSVLLPFSTSYLCEVAFSALNEIKNKKRERLINVEEELRVAHRRFHHELIHYIGLVACSIRHAY